MASILGLRGEAVGGAAGDWSVEKEEELEVILEGATVWVELADSLLKEVPELKPQEARRC